DVASRLLPGAAPGHGHVSAAVPDAPIDAPEARGGQDTRLPGEPARAHRTLLSEATMSLQGRQADAKAGPQASAKTSPWAGPRIAPAIAVVPFSVSNGRSGQSIIGHLLAHEIIARLSQSKEFDVISRLSTRAFCGHRARLSDFGARLGADYVLWGNCE